MTAKTKPLTECVDARAVPCGSCREGIWGMAAAGQNSKIFWIDSSTGVPIPESELLSGRMPVLTTFSLLAGTRIEPPILTI